MMDPDREALIRLQERDKAREEMMARGQEAQAKAMAGLSTEIANLRADVKSLEKEVNANSIAKSIGKTMLYILSVCGVTFLFNLALEHLKG